MLRLSEAYASRRSVLSPLLLGAGIWLGFPTVAAYQDIASLVSGTESAGARWSAFVERSVAGSVHAAEMPFADDDVTTAAISGSGVRMPGIGAVAFRTKRGEANAVPDEARVNRAEKQDRIVDVAPVAPPKAFNAGSILQRTSMLLRSTLDPQVRMAFAKPDIKGKEIQIATAFYAKEEKKPDPKMPAALAALVTNDKPDILATAYGPSAPDYSQSSPFEALLKADPDTSGGRFIPPMEPGDHAWVSTPLPASAFSSAEQRCLATAVYFEARGENLRGQAAVAQVILNRVRNPSYPKTICGVVYQNDGWLNACQFSFACDGKKNRITNPTAYGMAEDVAMAVTSGKIYIAEVGSSTHYHAAYVHPRWARTMEKMKKIGLHIFYRTYGGGWS